MPKISDQLEGIICPFVLWVWNSVRQAKGRMTEHRCLRIKCWGEVHGNCTKHARSDWIKKDKMGGETSTQGHNEKCIRQCIQKFQDRPPGTRTANGTALCHLVQLYRYFVSQFIVLCRHNPLKGTATSNTKGKRIFHYRLSPETFGYTIVHTFSRKSSKE
jgi:hypothetical protein